MSSDTPDETTEPVADAGQSDAETPQDDSSPDAATPDAETATDAEPVTAVEAAESNDAPADDGPADDASADDAPADDSASELTLGSGAPADETAEPVVAPTIRGKIDRFGVAMGTGRRKTAVARVRIKEGDGKFIINGRPLEEYLCVERDRRLVEAPLKAVEKHGKVDVWIRVNGGGTTGQTGAISLGIARALQAMDPGFHVTLSGGGYLTRDSRMVERKKYGFRKARRSFQFSKR